LFHTNVLVPQSEHTPPPIETLKDLDRSILIELKENIENLATDKLSGISERISLQNKELSDTLNYYISNLMFTEIFRILNMCIPAKPEINE
jgi:hypothetical protein